MKSYRCVLAGMALTAAVPAALPQTPASPDAPASAAQAAAPAAQSAMSARLLYELLLGEISFRQNNAQNGVGYMLNAARRTGDESLFRRATEMAIASRSGPAALETTRAWRQAFPHSVQAARFELQVLLVLGRVPETETPVRELLADLPQAEKESFIIALPALYQRAPDKAQTARIVEAALLNAIKDPALAPAAWTSIGRLRLQAGDKTGALSAATLGQTSGSPSQWPALLALNLLADADTPAAEPLLQRYLENPQADPEVGVGYARALVELGRMADAHTQLDALTRQHPDYPEGWLLKGALLADERRDSEAEPALTRFLQLADAQAGQPGMERDGGRNQARLMLARIAERRGDLSAAEQLLQQVDTPDQTLAVQLRRAQILARQGKLDEARQVIRAAPERQSEDARNKLLAEAQLLRDHQQPEQAYQMLSDELANDPDDETLLYEAGMAADRADRLQDMERLLRRLIEINPKSPSAYNALGYTLADRGLRLQEAKQLIGQAVQLAPDDSFIQDSLAWVEFRLGHLDEARRILEAAYKNRPDPEIAAHLGEVLWTLGEQDAARAIWRDGQRLDPGNETLLQTLKRLQVTP
ncbi:MAG: tetratricopeptide repeat protein [Desulfovibrionaceae bacterium]|nr:tetratricopeptide repeat protein [Desulfovibrionaceae bacterium]